MKYLDTSRVDTLVELLRLGREVAEDLSAGRNLSFGIGYDPTHPESGKVRLEGREGVGDSETMHVKYTVYNEPDESDEESWVVTLDLNAPFLTANPMSPTRKLSWRVSARTPLQARQRAEAKAAQDLSANPPIDRSGAYPMKPRRAVEWFESRLEEHKRSMAEKRKELAENVRQETLRHADLDAIKTMRVTGHITHEAAVELSEAIKRADYSDSQSIAKDDGTKGASVVSRILAYEDIAEHLEIDPGDPKAVIDEVLNLLDIKTGWVSRPENPRIRGPVPDEES